MKGIFPAISQVDAYWSALSASVPAPAVPARAMVNPRGIEGALSQAFILEMIAPTVARFRIAGVDLVDLMGMELRGMPLGALFLPASRDRMGETLAKVFSGPAKATLALTGETGIGRPPLEARMILLPLRDDTGAVTRVLGALETHGQAGRAPRRLNIVEARVADLRTGPETETPQAAWAQPAPAFDLADELAGNAAIYEPRPRPGRPALRVILNLSMLPQ